MNPPLRFVHNFLLFSLNTHVQLLGDRLTIVQMDSVLNIEIPLRRATHLYGK